MKPRALILHATGTNRDLDAAAALSMAGADPEIIHINLLRRGERRFDDYQMLVIPGGFSYADALGAGRLFALDLKTYFADAVSTFVAAGKPVIGICNGFQALVKAGILPGNKEIPATLTFNARGHFECRWVTLRSVSQTCLWTRELQGVVRCPVAHGEGSFTLSKAADLETLERRGQVALVYAGRDGQPAGGRYPENPNGSIGDIAGICNEQGNVLGLMPHPEDNIFDYQDPTGSLMEIKRDAAENIQEMQILGLRLFENGVSYARRM